MKYRTFGRTGWQISEIGYGMWGMGGQWGGAEDHSAEVALDLSVSLGCNFFDTAWAYAEGHSEKLLGKLLKRYPDKKLYTASKIPPKNLKWPSKPEYALKDCYPESHIIEYTEKSLKNLGVETIDLMQFHVWEDSWAEVDEWKSALGKLKQHGKIAAAGISINRWEPENGLDTLKTGEIDAIQVIYNIFDQAPEDHLFPLCRELNIGVIARVPFDEGTLTGKLTKETRFADNDWRSTYFVQENLVSSVEKADALKSLIPSDMTMAQMALRFILANDDVSTTIPGMRKQEHVRSNLGVSDGKRLQAELLNQLKLHRWDRQPTAWSQ